MPLKNNQDHARVSRLRAILKEKECTHVLVSDPVDVRAICGFHSSNVFLLISTRQHLLFTDFRYRDAAQVFCGRTPPWRLREITESSYSFLKETVTQGSVLGVQSEALTVDQLDKIRAAVKGVAVVKLSGAVARLSLVKTDRERAVMRRCAHIADEALARTVRQMRRGMTEREVRDLLEEHCRNLGSQRPAFETIVLFGEGSALPHGVCSDRPLRSGDWVLFDFGCHLDGLCSDMTRTVVMGRATRRQREMYEIVRRAQETCRKGIRAGMRCCDADALARDVIKTAGYGARFGHATGHGVGYRVHEAPRVGSTSTEILQRGSVVTVEPGIYIPEVGGVRIEDMVYLGGDKNMTLTTFPRHLMELGI